MADYVTRDEQQQMGLLRPQERFVPAKVSQAHELTNSEQAMLGQAATSAGEMVAHRQMTHIARSDDTAVTGAVASLIYSAAYGVAAAIITTGLLFMGWLLIGGDGVLYALGGLILWGVCILASLMINRWQGLWFSPTGLGHHEIDSRERVALHVIDQHVELIRERWEQNHAQ